MSDQLTRYENLICAATDAEILEDVTLGGRLVLGREGGVSVSYAPLDHIQHGAQVVIVGITPGAQQAQNAILEVRRQLAAGADHGTALAAAKTYASFSGSMRAYLIAMLDHVGLAAWLGIATTAELWAGRVELVHFTSALRHPVFFNGKNYNGSPPMTASPLLCGVLETCLAEEAAALLKAVWVPLGPKANEGLQYLVARGQIHSGRVLAGLPHPSGANGERVAYFLGRKARDKLSRMTSPDALDAARTRIRSLVSALPAVSSPSMLA